MKIELDEFCPCCGYKTLDSRDRLEYEICPICLWEDDPFQFENIKLRGANRVSLIQAQMNFEIFGACEKDMDKNTRKPYVHEERKINWGK